MDRGVFQEDGVNLYFCKKSWNDIVSIMNADVEEGPCRNVGSALKSMVRLTSGRSRQLISSMGTLCLCIIC